MMQGPEHAKQDGCRGVHRFETAHNSCDIQALATRTPQIFG